jgi:hypothetical protein
VSHEKTTWGDEIPVEFRAHLPQWILDVGKDEGPSPDLRWEGSVVRCALHEHSLPMYYYRGQQIRPVFGKDEKEGPPYIVMTTHVFQTLRDAVSFVEKNVTE